MKSAEFLGILQVEFRMIILHQQSAPRDGAGSFTDIAKAFDTPLNAVQCLPPGGYAP
jgi:hypothetical protein